MKQQITKLNESALLSLGMDLPTVKALSNIIRVTGNLTDSVTVPEVAGQVDETSQAVVILKEQVTLLQAAIDIIESAPSQIIFDRPIAEAFNLLPAVQIIEHVQFLQVELRQVAERQAQTSEFVESQVSQISERVAQITEHFTTEVRQIADQQISNANLIQELKQGTML